MKPRFSSISAALCLMILSAHAALAQASATPDLDWLSRMLRDGWRKTQEGVLQRQPGDGRVETFTYGEAGRSFRIRKLEERLASLEREHATYPSARLAQAIETLRDELAEASLGGVRLRAEGLSAAGSESFLGEASGCQPTLTAIADAGPLTDAPGVTASAGASYSGPCGDLGNTYAFAYSRATDESTMTTKTQEDPRYGGASLHSAATASVNGTLDCYSEAYASASNPSLGLNYEASDTNFSCPAPVQWPFRTAFRVPGTIKAADFDNGGEGVAYHELTPGTGSDYRSTEVGLYEDVVVWLYPGEWLEYTIDVVTPGAYVVVAQVGAEDPGGSFHIELDDVDVTGPVAVPDTDSWGAWGTAVSAPVRFTAGRHVLRLAVDTYFQGFYSLRIVPAQAPFGGVVRTLPGTIRAVDFDEGGEQISYHDNTAGCDGVCSYRQTEIDHWDTIVYHTSPGEWMEYTVDVTAAGTYTLSLQVAAAEDNGIFHVEVDGVDVSGPLSFPNTGFWNVFQTVSKPGVSLTAGRKVVRLVVDSNAGHAAAGSFYTFTVH